MNEVPSSRQLPFDAGKGLPLAVGEQIARALTGLRFGSVEIILHEGKVVQIERKEKVRLEK